MNGMIKKKKKKKETQKSGNSVAHALARCAKNCQDSLVWIKDVPPDIIHVFFKDSVSV